MIDLYKISKQARVQAERTQDPKKYELAAAYFYSLGMQLAAQRCLDRAKNYDNHDYPSPVSSG
jgi:hypothetical protein